MLRDFQKWFTSEGKKQKKSYAKTNHEEKIQNIDIQVQPLPSSPTLESPEQVPFSDEASFTGLPSAKLCSTCKCSFASIFLGTKSHPLFGISME